MEAKTAFETHTKKKVQSVGGAIDEHVAVEVETDASEFSIPVTHNQNGCPVAFFSRTLQGAEIRHASIEKKDHGIIETIHHWKHYLTGKNFFIKTDQCSIAYMFNNKQRDKIKNFKIMRWRMELSGYSFDMVYRPEAENINPYNFS